MVKQFFKLTHTDHLTMSVDQQSQKRWATMWTTGDINNCGFQMKRIHQLHHTASINSYWKSTACTSNSHWSKQPPSSSIETGSKNNNGEIKTATFPNPRSNNIFNSNNNLAASARGSGVRQFNNISSTVLLFHKAKFWQFWTLATPLIKQKLIMHSRAQKD